MTLTATDLIVLLTFWSDPAANVSRSHPPQEAVRKKLLPFGLVHYKEDTGYQVTEKGDVHLRHLLNQPLPREKQTVVWTYEPEEEV